jgi:hypothetical protein
MAAKSLVHRITNIQIINNGSGSLGATIAVDTGYVNDSGTFVILKSQVETVASNTATAFFNGNPTAGKTHLEDLVDNLVPYLTSIGVIVSDVVV